ncbi:MAG: excinuclease ABC subunit UvrC, partial [Panacagrimonas sp.]
MRTMAQGFDPRSFITQLTTQPGVYRMYDAGDELLYVGKARNLKKRVSSYFLRASGNPRIESMVSQIRRIEVSLTHTEDEALILESNLIKEYSPRYNVVYRDDKSYPYVRFTAHEYPRICYYRGAKTGKDRYFGPFPSASTVRETLQALQKLFRLRPCRDSFFANRSRPCLQHQIGRCSAPCVGLISKDDYARDLQRAARLLEGKGDALATELVDEMDAAANRLEFELAAQLRDQIAALKRVRENRAISGGARNADVLALASHPSSSCLVVVSVRDGLNLGHRSYFPRHPQQAAPEELLESFIAQHYLDGAICPEILVSHRLPENAWLQDTLSARAGQAVRIAQPHRGAKKRLMDMALQTAAQSLSARLSESASMDQRLIELREALELESIPERLECFDISHSQGERTVASCVVFNQQGPLKSAYRKFNIDSAPKDAVSQANSPAAGRPVTAGDDYAAIAQAVARRYGRIKSGEGTFPDLLLIDGGQGQLNAALEALDQLEIRELAIVAVAKGPSRRPG